MDDRYQFQTRLVRTLRWLRWKPWYSVQACCLLAHWLISGADLPPWSSSRGGYAAHIWTIYQGLADCKMKHYFTTDEIRKAIH